MHSEQRKNESSILPSEKNMGLLLKIGGMEDYLKIGKWYSCNQKACVVWVVVAYAAEKYK